VAHGARLIDRRRIVLCEAAAKSLRNLPAMLLGTLRAEKNLKYLEFTQSFWEELVQTSIFLK
jgi:hypothetical protein